LRGDKARDVPHDTFAEFDEIGDCFFEIGHGAFLHWFVVFYSTSLRQEYRVLSRPDWSRMLPRPLVIPTVMTLRTLADVRELIRHLPKERRGFDSWRHVAKTLDEAARCAIDPADVSVALRLVLMLEGAECRQK
jgi:hypothetical protein